MNNERQEKLKKIIKKFCVNELINLQNPKKNIYGKFFYEIKNNPSHQITSSEVELIQETTQALSRAYLTPAEFLNILYIRKSQTIYQLKRANLEKVEQFINDNKIENYQPLSPAKRQLVLHLLATAARLHSVVNTQYYGTAATDEIKQILDSVITLIEDLNSNKNLDNLNQRLSDINNSLEANKQNNTWVKRAWDYMLGCAALFLTGIGIFAAGVVLPIMIASFAFIPALIISVACSALTALTFAGLIFLGNYISLNRGDIKGLLARASESLGNAITLAIPKKDKGIPVAITFKSVKINPSLITTQRDTVAATVRATVTADEKTTEPATTRTKRRITV